MIRLTVFEPLEALPLLSVDRRTEPAFAGLLALDDSWPPFFAVPPTPERRYVIGVTVALTRSRALAIRWRFPA